MSHSKDVTWRLLFTGEGNTMKKNGQIYDIFRVLNEDKKLKIFYLLALMADALVFPLAQVFTSFSESGW